MMKRAYKRSALKRCACTKIRLGWHSVLSRGQYGPYGPQSVYAMFIPWQGDDETRQDAIVEAKRAKAEGGASRYVVVDPLGEGQYEL